MSSTSNFRTEKRPQKKAKIRNTESICCDPVCRIQARDATSDVALICQQNHLRFFCDICGTNFGHATLVRWLSDLDDILYGHEEARNVQICLESMVANGMATLKIHRSP